MSSKAKKVLVKANTGKKGFKTSSVPKSEEIPLPAQASNLEVLTESQKSLTLSTNLAKGSDNILEKAEIDSESEPAEDIEEKTSP